MIKLKKVLSLVMVGILSVSILAGCSKKEDSKGKEGKEKLVVWSAPLTDHDADAWKPIFEKFEKENNCEIEFQIVPWDNYAEKYATAISAGEGPDIGYMYAEMFPQFIEMGAVEDLTPYLEKSGTSDNYLYLDDAKMMGGIYGLPIEAANPGVLYYNKDILEKLGEKPPKTWDDFKRICEKATKDTDGDGKIDQWGLAQGWGSKVFGSLNWNRYPYLWQAGGDIYNDDLKSVKFNNAEGLKAANFINDMKKYIPEDALSKDSNEMIESVFGPGKAAFTIMLSSAATSTFDKSFPDLNWGYVTSLEDKTVGSFASVDDLTLMSACKNKELGFKLLEYMLSKESMEAFHKEIPRAPVAKGEKYQGDPRFEEMVTRDKHMYRPLTVGPHGVEIYEYLWKQLQMMIAGDITPEQALNESAKYANGLLAQ